MQGLTGNNHGPIYWGSTVVRYESARMTVCMHHGGMNLASTLSSTAAMPSYPAGYRCDWMLFPWSVNLTPWTLSGWRAKSVLHSISPMVRRGDVPYSLQTNEIVPCKLHVDPPGCDSAPSPAEMPRSVPATLQAQAQAQGREVYQVYERARPKSTHPGHGMPGACRASVPFGHLVVPGRTLKGAKGANSSTRAGGVGGVSAAGRPRPQQQPLAHLPPDIADLNLTSAAALARRITPTQRQMPPSTLWARGEGQEGGGTVGPGRVRGPRITDRKAWQTCSELASIIGGEEACRACRA